MTTAASMKLTINSLMGAQRGILSIYQKNKQKTHIHTPQKKKIERGREKRTPKPTKNRGKQQSILEEPPPKTISAETKISLVRCRA